MKIWVPILIICMTIVHSYGQEAILEKGKKAVLKDPDTQYSYILNTAHTYITAFDNKGKWRWTSFTNVCNYCRNCGPVAISSMELREKDVSINKNKSRRKKVLMVTHCMCWSYFELETGKYHPIGCD